MLWLRHVDSALRACRVCSRLPAKGTSWESVVLIRLKFRLVKVVLDELLPIEPLTLIRLFNRAHSVFRVGDDDHFGTARLVPHRIACIELLRHLSSFKR